MNRSLIACTACAELVFEGSCACPHCGHRYPCASKRLGAAAALLGLTLGAGACHTVQADYGASISTDSDYDGYGIDIDCDDEDPDIHPDATEVAGDGVDSNCDDEDDT